MAVNEKKQVKEPSSIEVGKFFKEVKAETKRITWPPKNEVKKSTLIVLFFCVASAVIIGLMDYGFQGLFKLIFTK
ncbi:preprotein translocase subunit SecE [Clostridium sp. MB40-C1]|uniref:preprotein translocase subunit SecE n=1 Tax=Clostridium sp. MB40-C1 TaxID=3070996 RepID=UPI0027E07F27|nr:preprotein translocase subunit SecE [Clostridium sp. MB40-C1]WMJ80326.1 preprotein translocase subunit SecE [Clostridium sp. MB40-C1]